MWYTSSSTNWNSYKAGLTRNLFSEADLFLILLIAMPIATYIFNELSGYSVADSTKKLGTAYFGFFQDYLSI